MIERCFRKGREMADLSLDSSLILRIKGENLTTEDVERAMAAELERQGYAKETFTDAILEREKVFPTALDMGGVNVAMPHCDIANVNKAAICIGVLEHPVAWHRMDDPDSTCDVSLVTMLALTEAHAHLEMLQKVIALVQNQELIEKVVSTESEEEIFSLIGDQLL